MGTEKYTDRALEDEKILQELEIKALEKAVAEMPSEKRREPKLVVANRSLSLEELLEEVRKGTPVGKHYLQAQRKSRLEQLRRK